jgi:hypothetical protein
LNMYNIYTTESKKYNKILEKITILNSSKNIEIDEI